MALSSTVNNASDNATAPISSLAKLATTTAGNKGIRLDNGVALASALSVGGGGLDVSLGNRAVATTGGRETFGVSGNNALRVGSDINGNVVRNGNAMANSNKTVCVRNSNDTLAVDNNAVRNFATDADNNNICVESNAFGVAKNTVRGYATPRNTNMGVCPSSKGAYAFAVDNSTRVGGYDGSNISVT